MPRRRREMSCRSQPFVASSGFSNQAIRPTGSAAVTSSPSSSRGPRLVASNDNVGPFVGVDIGNRYSRGMIRSDRTDMVDGPGLSGIARLFEPKHRALRFQRDGDDIETAIRIEIEEVEVES